MLQSAGVLEEFDPVCVYVAIADFAAVEESSISLTAGQCVQVQLIYIYCIIIL